MDRGMDRGMDRDLDRDLDRAGQKRQQEKTRYVFFIVGGRRLMELLIVPYPQLTRNPSAPAPEEIPLEEIPGREEIPPEHNNHIHFASRFLHFAPQCLHFAPHFLHFAKSLALAHAPYPP